MPAKQKHWAWYLLPPQYYDVFRILLWTVWRHSSVFWTFGKRPRNEKTCSKLANKRVTKTYFDFNKIIQSIQFFFFFFIFQSVTIYVFHFVFSCKCVRFDKSQLLYFHSSGNLKKKKRFELRLVDHKGLLYIIYS